MKLARAKFKDIEQLPELVCCDGYVKKILEFKDTVWIIDLDSITHNNTGFNCPMCGKNIPAHTRILTTTEYSIAIEMLDIDEALCPH